jgi:hypothetical protein
MGMDYPKTPNKDFFRSYYAFPKKKEAKATKSQN